MVTDYSQLVLCKDDWSRVLQGLVGTSVPPPQICLALVDNAPLEICDTSSFHLVPWPQLSACILPAGLPVSLLLAAISFKAYPQALCVILREFAANSSAL